MEETEFTLEGRVLCSDDACIGTVGPDRRCKVCGRPYEGQETPVEASAAHEPPAPSEDVEEAADAAEGPSHEEPSERVCCPDDACVGLIGPDGKCGTCGKSA